MVCVEAGFDWCAHTRPAEMHDFSGRRGLSSGGLARVPCPFLEPSPSGAERNQAL